MYMEPNTRGFKDPHTQGSLQRPGQSEHLTQQAFDGGLLTQYQMCYGLTYHVFRGQHLTQ